MADDQRQPFTAMSMGVDVGALLAVIASWERLIPAVAAVFAIVVYSFEIYNMPQLVRARDRRAARRAAKNAIADAAHVAALLVKQTAADTAAAAVIETAEKAADELARGS